MNDRLKTFKEQLLVPPPPPDDPEYSTDAAAEMEPTPGPWEWRDGALYGANGKRIIETDGGFYPPHGRDRALIAKAPPLLEMLQEAAEHLEWIGYGDTWERECAFGVDLKGRIEKTLAAARGEE